MIDYMGVEEVEDIDFICPYCKKPLKKLLSKQVKINFAATKPVYACPSCKSILPAPNAM